MRRSVTLDLLQLMRKRGEKSAKFGCSRYGQPLVAERGVTGNSRIRVTIPILRKRPGASLSTMGFAMRRDSGKHRRCMYSTPGAKWRRFLRLSNVTSSCRCSSLESANGQESRAEMRPTYARISVASRPLYLPETAGRAHVRSVLGTSHASLRCRAPKRSA